MLTPFSAPLESPRLSEVNSSTIEEQKMFGRQVTLKLKDNSATELTRIAENEIIPILRKQKGFRDETTFIAPERSEAIANSFWDSKEDAEAYNLTGYPEVLKTLSNVIDGTPTVKTFEFANSTFLKAATAKLV
jgi:hypothetical protein